MQHTTVIFMKLSDIVNCCQYQKCHIFGKSQLLNLLSAKFLYSEKLAIIPELRQLKPCLFLAGFQLAATCFGGFMDTAVKIRVQWLNSVPGGLNIQRICRGPAIFCILSPEISHF